MAKRLVGIWGYYGFANTGDEAILHCLLAGLKGLPRATEELELCVFSADPAYTRSAHQVNAVVSATPRTFRDRVRTLVNREYRQAGKIYSQLDTFLVGGGGLFFDHPNGNFYLLRLLRRIRTAVEEGKQVILTGVGVGPLYHQESRDVIRETFSRIEAILVRDEPSAHLLREIGVTAPLHITGDLVFLLQPAESGRIDAILRQEQLEKTARPVIGISLQGAETEKPETKETLRRFLQYAIESLNADIWFVPMQTRGGWDDRPAAAALAQELDRSDRVKLVTGEYLPWETMGIMKECDAVLAMRLHGAILSMVNHVPVYGISYAPKVSRVFAELGHEDWQTPIDLLTSQNLIDGFTRIWAARPAIRAELVDLMTEARKRAELNFRHLATYLNTETVLVPQWQNQTQR